MKNFIFILSLLSGLCSFSQVGIGTSNPNAQLDIISNSPTNPSVIDGLLIPRIDKFPSINPGVNQDAMLIYLTKTVNEFPKGFYFWNASEIKWETISGNSFGNFFKPGTSSNPNNISDPMYRLGSIGIGTQEITAKLQIVLDSQQDIGIKKGLEVDNNNPAITNVTYGIISNNRSATNAVKYGIKNNVSALGNGVHYGIHSKTFQNGGTSDIYGIYNEVGNTFGAKSDNFGIYTIIGSTTSLGNIYGIYAKAEGNSSAKVFAGYFAGRVAIGMTPEEEYILPATRGKNEQILVTNKTGDVSWKYPNMMNYSNTGTEPTGIYYILEDVYTLRINNNVSSVTIPEASTNKGRILILIAFPGMGTRPFNFLDGDTLYDISTGNNITAISSGNRFMIQSIGTRWVVLFK